MEYKKKFKFRLYIMIFYFALGIFFVVSNLFGLLGSDVIFAAGVALAVSGAVNFIRIKRILNDENRLKDIKIKETDERNIMLAEKARSLTFVIYIIVCSVAMYVLYAIGKDDMGLCVAYNICGLIIVYLICYFIIKRRY